MADFVRLGDYWCVSRAANAPAAARANSNPCVARFTSGGEQQEDCEIIVIGEWPLYFALRRAGECHQLPLGSPGNANLPDSIAGDGWQEAEPPTGDTVNAAR